MRQIGATLKGRHLKLWVPETQAEMEAGHDAKPVRNGSGMLFHVERGRVITIIKKRDVLDIIWLTDGVIGAICTLYGGIMASEGDTVLELPRGWAAKNNLGVGDRLEVHGTDKAA